LATTSYVYDSFILALLAGEIVWATDTIKLTLHTSAYTPNQATDAVFADATNEVTGTNYTAGGVTIAQAAAGCSPRIVLLDAPDVSWVGLTVAEIRYMVLTDTTATQLIGYVDLGENVAVTAMDFVISWHPDGILAAQVA
jgi:hypothetical protein